MTQFISNREIYESVICARVPRARSRVWIATADLKDLNVDAGGREMVPFLGAITNVPSLLDSLAEQFDSVWRGAHCPACKRKAYCPDGPMA